MITYKQLYDLRKEWSGLLVTATSVAEDIDGNGIPAGVRDADEVYDVINFVERFFDAMEKEAVDGKA